MRAGRLGRCGAGLTAVILVAAVFAPAAPAQATAKPRPCTWSTWTIYKREHVTCTVARRALRTYYTAFGPKAWYCGSAKGVRSCNELLKPAHRFRYRRTPGAKTPPAPAPNPTPAPDPTPAPAPPDPTPPDPGYPYPY